MNMLNKILQNLVQGASVPAGEGQEGFVDTNIK